MDRPIRIFFEGSTVYMSESGCLSLEQFVRSRAKSMDILVEFGSRTVWEREDQTAIKLTEFLSPHTETFFCSLRPVFLHQLKSGMDVISYFSPLLCKDGLLSLLQFFRIYPCPPDSVGPLLLIHWMFAPFVPELWESKVAYYQAMPDAWNSFSERISDVYFILSIIDERQCSLSSIEKQLKNIKKIFEQKSYPQRFHAVMFISPAFSRTVQENDPRTEYCFRMVSLLQKTFELEINFVKWTDLLKADLRGTGFYDLNEMNFYYADSFVLNYFLSHGSVPICGYKNQPSVDFKISASMYHSYGISKNGLSIDSENKKALQKKMKDFLSSSFFLEEEARFSFAEAYQRGEKQGALSFELMAYQLACEIFTPVQEK